LHVIETTELIRTKFCTAIKTTTFASWVVQTQYNKSKMADGRRSVLKTVKPPYLSNVTA